MGAPRIIDTVKLCMISVTIEVLQHQTPFLSDARPNLSVEDVPLLTLGQIQTGGG